MLVLLLCTLTPLAAADSLRVTFHPARLRVGEVGWMELRGARPGAGIEGAVGGQPLRFFSHAGGHAALVAIDLESAAGAQPWSLSVPADPSEPHTLRGTDPVARREFAVA